MDICANIFYLIIFLFVCSVGVGGVVGLFVRPFKDHYAPDPYCSSWNNQSISVSRVRFGWLDHFSKIWHKFVDAVIGNFFAGMILYGLPIFLIAAIAGSLTCVMINIPMWFGSRETNQYGYIVFGKGRTDGEALSYDESKNTYYLVKFEVTQKGSATGRLTTVTLGNKNDAIEFIDTLLEDRAHYRNIMGGQPTHKDSKGHQWTNHKYYISIGQFHLSTAQLRMYKRYLEKQKNKGDKHQIYLLFICVNPACCSLMT